MHNQRLQTRCKSSKYKGVSWNKGVKKWLAQIGFNDKVIHLGQFGDEIEAAKVYDKAAKELFGDFAHTNF